MTKGKDIKLPKKAVKKIRESNLDKAGSKDLARAFKAIAPKKRKGVQ